MPSSTLRFLAAAASRPLISLTRQARSPLTAGNVYLTGLTASTNFPTMSPLQPTNHGQDAFISKVNPNGTSLVFSTYLGGSGPDAGRGIAVDTSGHAYLTGTSGSADFSDYLRRISDQPGRRIHIKVERGWIGLRLLDVLWHG